MKLSHITLFTLLFAVFALALPLRAQDATPEAAAQIAQRTFIAADGVASVSFPVDWLVSNSANSDSVISITVANSQDSMDKELFNQDSVFKPGEVHIEVEVIELTTLAKSLPEIAITTDSTPLDIVQALSEQGMPEEFTFGDPGTVTINGNPAVRMNLTAGKRGEGQLLLTIYDKKWLAGIILFAAPGEGDRWDIIARDILGSVKFDVEAEATAEATVEPTAESTVQPLELIQTAKTSSGLGVLSYPDKWFSRQFRSQSIYIANTQTALEKSFGSTFDMGEVNILASVSPTDDYIKQAELPLKPDATPLELLQMTITTVGATLKFGTPQETTVADKRAARVDFSGEGFEGTAWIIEYQNGALIMVQLLTASGEARQWQSTALAIAQSVRSTD